jgi:hypothetical protein
MNPDGEGLLRERSGCCAEPAHQKEHRGGNQAQAVWPPQRRSPDRSLLRLSWSRARRLAETAPDHPKLADDKEQARPDEQHEERNRLIQSVEYVPGH